MRSDRGANGEPALSRSADLVRSALASGAAEAEAFCKMADSRALVLEPDLPAGGKPRVTVSSCEVDGLALRVLDRRGRWGFAWRSPLPGSGGSRSGGAGDRALVLEALASASRSGSGRRRRKAGSPAGESPQDELAPVSGDEGREIDLGLDDPMVMASPVEALESRLAETRDAALGIVSDSSFVDRVRLNEARLVIALANSRGFRGSYRKSLALLSISIAPAAAGARPVLEERSVCRIAQLDFRECGIEAALRALPSRIPLPPPAVDLPVIFGPRATAALLAAVAPLTLPEGTSGFPTDADPEPPHVAGRGLWLADEARCPGAVGSSPFDGAGWSTGQTIVMAGGRPTGRLVSERGHCVRPTYREPPGPGLTNLRLISPSGAPAAMPGGPSLRVAAAQFVPGPLWMIRIVRGDWCAGDEPSGPADGLSWVGPLKAILGGVAAAGPDLRRFHVGMPIDAASVTIEGLNGWFVDRRGALGIPTPGWRADQSAAGGRIRSKTE